jgi:hypothetical protein
MATRSIPGGKEAKRVADYSSPPRLRIQGVILILRARFYRMVYGLKIGSKIVHDVARLLKARIVEAQK